MRHLTEDEALLAKSIWEASRRDEGSISATGANIIAKVLSAEGYRLMEPRTCDHRQVHEEHPYPLTNETLTKWFWCEGRERTDLKELAKRIELQDIDLHRHFDPPVPDEFVPPWTRGEVKWASMSIEFQPRPQPEYAAQYLDWEPHEEARWSKLEDAQAWIAAIPPRFHRENWRVLYRDTPDDPWKVYTDD